MKDLLLHDAFLLLELDDLLLQKRVLVLLVLDHLEKLVEVRVDDRRERALVLVVQRAQPLLHVQDLLPKELDLLLVLTDKLLSLLKHVLQTQRVDSEHTALNKSDIFLPRP